MVKRKQTIELSEEDVIRVQVAKRERIYEKKRSFICMKRDAIYEQLQAAKATNDPKAVRRLQSLFNQCEKRMAVIDLREGEDHLVFVQAQLASLEKQINSTKNMDEKLMLMKLAEAKDNDVYDAQMFVRQLRNHVASFETPKTKAKKPAAKKSRKSVRKDLKKMMESLPPAHSKEELKREYGPAMEHARALVHKAFADARKKGRIKSKKAPSRKTTDSSR